MNKAILSGAEDSPQKRPSVPLPARDSVTAVQVNNVLSIIGTVTPLLLLPSREIEGLPELDGGVLASAATTFIRACDRLDEMLADNSRWTFDAQNHLEAKLDQVYDEQIQAIRMQKAATEMMMSPHYRHNPVLIQLPGGRWGAILGDINKLENCIFGSGDSPAQAYAAFDKMFNDGQLPEHLKRLIIELETPSNETQQQQQNPVVAPTDSTTQKTPRKRRDTPRNGGSVG